MKTDGFIPICLSYAAGVAFGGIINAGAIGAAVALPLGVGFLFIGALGQKRVYLPFILCYFCIGAMSFWSRAVFRDYFLGPGEYLGSVARPAREAFRSFIGGIPFKSPTTGALVKALVSGDKSDMPRTVVQAFRSCGASHILALSGLHLGIIAGALRACLFWLGRSRAAVLVRSILVVAASFYYMMLCGAGASLQRAFLFILFSAVRENCPERRPWVLGSFCFALTVQLAVEPLSVLSVSFQLSYLAMVGILLIYPWLEDFYPPEWRFAPLRALWKSIALSVACQIPTAPVSWFVFGSLPHMFLLTNLLMLPMCEALILLGVLTIAMSAAGVCPLALIALVDFLAGLVVKTVSLLSF